MGGTTASGGTGGAAGASGYAGASSLGDCLSGAYRLHTYLFCNVKLDWFTARDNCASIGMQLVRVDDDAENQYVHDYIYVCPLVVSVARRQRRHCRQRRVAI